jgi:hypothetical protein
VPRPSMNTATTRDVEYTVFPNTLPNTRTQTT